MISGGTLQVGGGDTGGSIVGSVLDNGVLTFSLFGASTFGGVISGEGALTEAGRGVTLTASNGYTGATTISGGTLQVGNGGSGASIGATSSVADNGGLVFDHADAVVFSPAINGSGTLVQTGSSVLTLLGSDTYSGSTTVSAGTLQIGNGTSGEFLASPSVNLANGAALVFNHADTLTYNGAISGSGSLTKLGGGAVCLGGANAYAGTTAVNAGTLEASTTAALPGYATPGQITVAAGATLAVNTSGWTVAGITALLGGNGSDFANGSMLAIDTSGGGLWYYDSIAGNMGLAALGGNMLILTTTNTYTGPTLITAGTLQIGNGGSGASIGMTLGVTDNATLIFDHGDSVTFSQTISGSGNLVQTGSGVLTVTGSSTYTGVTTISAGTLQVGNGGSGASIGGSSSVVDNGSIVFNHNDTLILSPAISGYGSLTQMGSGILILLGSNGYYGGTTVSAGTLQVGNGTNGEYLASPTVYLGDGAAIVFNHADALTYNGSISGSGSLTKTGWGH